MVYTDKQCIADKERRYDLWLEKDMSMKQNLHVPYKLKADKNIINGIQRWNEKQTINSGMKYVWKEK